MENISSKSVGILVVTYNRIKLLKETIQSLRQQTFTDTQIVVVNNGSTDETPAWLSEQKDIITITQKNLGSSGGFSAGMKYIAENGYKYCWLMDDDVECKPTALSELLKALQYDENIGFVCSKVEGINGEPMNVPEVDARPTNNGYSYWYDRIDDGMIRVKSATFVSVLLSTERIYEVGLPYKEFFIWGDDTEYTMRITQKHISYMVCKSEIVHKRDIQGSLSFDSETNPKRLKNYFYKGRNNIFIYKKYYSSLSIFKYYIHNFMSIFKLLIQFQFTKAKIVLKSTISSFTFRPKVDFPKK